MAREKHNRSRSQLTVEADDAFAVSIDSSYFDSYEDPYSLESILAEFRGAVSEDSVQEAPSLNRFLPEEVQDSPTRPLPVKKVEATSVQQVPRQPLPREVEKPRFETRPSARPATDNEPQISEQQEKKLQNPPKTTPRPTETPEFAVQVLDFEKFRLPPDDDDQDVARVEESIEQVNEIEEHTQKTAKRFFGLFKKNDDENSSGDEAAEDQNENPPPARVKRYLLEEESVEEPDYRRAMRRFANGCNKYAMQSMVSLVLSVLIAILTAVFQGDAALPFGIGNNKVVFTGILLILLLCVMMLNIDRLVRGLSDFFKGGPGVDSLNFMSCLLTVASAAYILITRDTSTGMPFCVISAFSLTFTLWGEKIYYRALTETMKTALSVTAPYGVIAEVCDDLDKTIIKKVNNRSSGFYNNLVQADVGENSFKVAAPILMVAAVALGIYASLGHQLSKHILHNLAALMAAAAPFSMMITYALPFSHITRRTRKAGAAVAGWGGADDIYHTDGASITDDDLFPSGTVSLGGIKIFEEVAPDKALRYTGSLIIASNSGLSLLFTDHLSKNGLTAVSVDDFTCYEGGIGGLIRQDRVIVGSAAFMNLMGIRVPPSLNVKNAVFTAVNKRLIAVFAIEYTPVKSVQGAIVSVLRYHVKLFFAVRDFNITPIMLEQKFKVPVDDVEYIPIRNTYNISDATRHEAKRVSAILTRDGLNPFVESITGGRRLRTTALVATAFSLISAVFGMLLMFTGCWSEAYQSAAAMNLFLYMLSMLAGVVLIAGYAKFRN